MIVAIFSVLIVDYDFSFLSRIQFDWIANVQAFINSISRGLNNFYHSLFEVDFSISNPSFFSFSIILTTGYLLLLTISSGLLWVVGNRVLLSNLNQNKFNGG